MDYLTEDPTEYAIYTSPSTLKYKTDILGNVQFTPLQEINFVFASRESYGRDVLQNLQNLGFFQEVINWMILQNETKNFPAIAEGAVVSILPSTTQFLFSAGSDTGLYQIQCKLIYRRN